MKRIFLLIIGFVISNSISHAQVVRLWSTYYGSTGNEATGTHIVTDASGNIYLGAATDGSSGIASGGFQNTYGGGVFDAYLAKFDSSGNLLWATYYGGPGFEFCTGLAVDNAGNIIMGGRTTSTSGIASGGHQNSYGGGAQDGFLVKFNSAGVRQWASYYGGAAQDEGQGLCVDISGNIYLAGITKSTNGIASGGHQNTQAGTSNYDGFLVKFNPAGVRQWGTYYGGFWEDQLLDVCTDVSGNVYAGGQTNSTSGISSGGFQNTHGGGAQDGFLVKFNSAGTRQWATYYGGSLNDYGSNVACDLAGNPYFSGSTESLNAIASGGHQNSFGGNLDGFLVKFNSSGARQWGTYYGGSNFENLYAITTDPFDNVYMTGQTGSTSGIAAAGFQNTIAGGTDGYLVKFNSSGVRISATYYGGTSNDYAQDVISDLSGNMYLAGNTESSNGISYNGYDNSYNGSSDQFLVKFAVCTSSPPSQPGAITGATSFCSGTTLTYDIAPVSNTLYYVWTLPAGWTGTSMVDSIIATSGITSGNISVSAVNGCGYSAPQTLAVTVNTTPFTPGIISGNDTVCDGTTHIYSVTPVAGATSYTWTLPGGWSGTSTTNSITTMAGSTGGTISVTATNSCGTSGASSLNITVETIPGTPGTISGSTTICPSSVNTYSIAAVSGATSYTWTLPSGWSGTSLTNSINTTASANSGNITVTANNSCGISSPSVLAITVDPLPGTPGPITGNMAVCAGSSNTYFIAPVSSATSYTWTLPAGWAGSSTADSIATIAGSNGGNISVTANNACGSSSASVLPVTVNTIPATPGMISGTTPVCEGSSNTYSVFPVPGATSYTWTLPPGWSGTSTTSSINTIAAAPGGNITVTANNSCGSSSPSGFTITVMPVLTTIGAITGNISVCSGSSNTYSIPAVIGATSYTWTLPSGWTGTSTTNSITTTASSTSGNITVTASNACGTSSPSTLAVTVNTIPANPGTISGPTLVCLGSTTIWSIVSDTNATSYTWTLPPGWGGSSTTDSIMATVGSSTGNITVTANNSCGSSSPSSLTILNVWTIPSNPGIIFGPNPVCEGDTNWYNVALGSMVTSYAWNLPLGWTGTPTGNAIYATPGPAGGTISVTASNLCGTSTPSTATITVNTIPNTPGTISGPDTICQGTTNNYAISAVGGATSYTWTLPSLWTGSSTTNSINTSASATSGNITVTANNTCGNSSPQTLMVTVHAAPTVNFTYPGEDTICINHGLQTLSGGSPLGGTYSGTGVSGTSFDPNTAGTGDHNISYSFTDANNCSNTDVVSIVVLGCAGMGDPGNEITVNIYPNPFTSQLTIDGMEGTCVVNLYNNLGQRIKTFKLNAANNSISTADLCAGIYFISLTDPQGKVRVYKLVKE